MAYQRIKKQLLAPMASRTRQISMGALAGACLALLTALLIAPATAQAAPARSAGTSVALHAYYTGSVPAANAAVKTAPTQVIVHFAENVNPDGSDVIVYDARGKQVSTAPGQVDRADLKTMTVPMKGDGSEIYLVVWHTVSADDGDPDAGAFNFLVNPSADSLQAVQAANGSNSGSASNANSSSGTPIWLTVVIAILALLVGAGALFFAQRSGWAPAPARAAGPAGPAGKAG